MKKIKQTELNTIYDSRKTFYKKANVLELEQKNDIKTYLLKSYNSIVASVEEQNGVKSFYINDTIKTNLLFSQTTLRHIREFYKQYFNTTTETKKDLQKYLNASKKYFLSEV